MSSLADAAELRVPVSVVEETWRALREFGHQGNEGFVLWLGRIDSRAALVGMALVPPQSSIRSEEGVGYFVNADTLFHLNRTLHRSGLRLLAQVHSHPGAAYHSSTDDAYAVVTTEGGFSIVVPNFARGEPDPSECAVYRLEAGSWTELGISEIERAILWG